MPGAVVSDFVLQVTSAPMVELTRETHSALASGGHVLLVVMMLSLTIFFFANFREPTMQHYSGDGQADKIPIQLDADDCLGPDVLLAKVANGPGASGPGSRALNLRFSWDFPGFLKNPGPWALGPGP